MKFIQQKLNWVLLAGLVLVAPLAKADLTSSLSVNGCSSGCGVGPFGTVSVTSINANTVQVNLTLASNVIFANTGAGDALGYNVNKATTIVAGSLTTGFAAGPANQGFSTFGTFLSSISCTTGCGSGTSAPQNPGPLSFWLFSATGLTSDNFIANSPQGYFFAADIGVKNAAGAVVGTGNVGAPGVTPCEVNCQSPPPVPEPSSVLLLGTAGLGIFLSLKRRRAATKQS